METKKQIYVHVKDEQIKSTVIRVLAKHKQLIVSIIPIFSDYKDYPYLKYDSEGNYWVLSDYHNGGIAEISAEQLDVILSYKKPISNSDDLVIEEVSIQERYQKPFTPKLQSELLMEMVNKIVDEKNNSDTKKTILQEAEEIINGSRAEDYGSVTENFTKIAVGWKEIFADGNFTPRRVALAMIWLKICRDVNTPKHDNILDIAGYAGCIGKMDNEVNKDSITNEKNIIK